MSKTRWFSVVAMALLGLAACGQKGPLTLPPPPAAAASAASGAATP